MRSEELGVRSEELVRAIRSCWNDPPEISCRACPYKCPYERGGGCVRTMALDAADEIERLAKELEAKKGLTLAAPRKPGTDSETGWYCCPACGEVFEVVYPNFCPVCGQALDWEADDA